MIQIQGRTESCEGRGINNIVWTIDIGGIDCGLATVSLFRRVAHHGKSKMAAQAGKSSSDRDGKNFVAH